MSKISTYARDVRSEFSQISWPERSTAFRLTFVVVIFTIVFAAFLGLVDYVFGAAVRSLLSF